MKQSPAASRSRGVLFILLAAFFFSCMNVCVRLAGDIPTIQKSFFRNSVAFVAAAAVLIREGKGFMPADRRNIPVFLVRSVCGTLGLLANFYAVDHLLLSDASMLNKLSPFFAVLFSFFFLKERLSGVQILTLAGAFAGAMLIIRPSGGSLTALPALIGFAGGMFAGAAYTAVRMLGRRGERGPLIVFFFSGFSCLAAVPFMLADFCPMSTAQLLALLGAGVCGAGGQFSVTAAYCHAPAREISIYDYSQVIFSALLGFFLFGDLPDGFSLLGYAVICTMAVVNYRFGSRKAAPPAR